VTAKGEGTSTRFERRGHDAERRLERDMGLRPADADALRIGGNVRDRHLRPQHVHAQSFGDRLRDVRSDQQPKPSGARRQRTKFASIRPFGELKVP
jgi:hypothetical protein